MSRQLATQIQQQKPSTTHIASVLLQRSSSGLLINRPGDRFEQEADRVAATVTSGGTLPMMTLSNAPVLRRDTSFSDDLSIAPPIVDDVLYSPGQPLDAATRAFMEPRFGRDFSGVRVHTDERAAESARNVNANAYTVGHNIVFDSGRLAPGTHEGRRLIAHELTHVVQQRGSPIDTSALEPQGSAAEREAHATASDVMAGRAARPVSAAPRGIPRDVGWARRGGIPDPHGVGYNTIFTKAGPDSKAAVLALTSIETPSMFVDVEKYKKLEAPVRKSILALEPHAAGTACAGWFDVMRANDPDFKPQLTPEQIRAGEAAYHSSTREAALQKKTESAKADLRTLDPVAIDARWKDNKYGLITAAQTPNHGIKAEALHAIWIKYWSDKYKFAEDLERAIVKNESGADFDKYIRKLNAYEDGDRNAMGSDYAKARNDVALGNLMFRHSVEAMEICRAADAQGKSLTLDELTDRVIGFAKIWDPMVGGLETYLTFGRGGPEPIKTEPAKTEPVKTQPVKTEPVKTQPVKTEPAKTQPAKTEPVKTEPAKTEPVKTQPVKTEPAKTQPDKTEPAKTEPVKTQPVKTEPAKTQPVKTEPAKTQPVKTEPAKTQPAKTQPAKTAPARTEPKPAEPKPDVPTKSQAQRLEEIKQERNLSDAKIRDLDKKRLDAEERSREASAKAVNAQGEERNALLEKTARNRESAEKWKNERDAERIRNNKLRDEESRLAPPSPAPKSWPEAEEALRKEFGGQKQSLSTATANSDLGRRDIDCFTSGDRVSREAKLGEQNWSTRLQEEIDKDVALMKAGKVSRTEWYFYENPNNGKIGPNSGLKEALDKAGIRVVRKKK